MNALLLFILLAAAPVPPLVNTNDLQRAGTTVRLPGLVIHDVASPYLEAAGKVARTNDLLEFIAVEPEGRDYESLLTLDCKPSALQFALLLIGCETGGVLRIEAEYKHKRVPIEQWLIDRKTKKPPTGLRWKFNGSYFSKNPITEQPVFLADAEQAHIVLWWQPSIVINLADDRGNPYRGDDQGFEANPAAVPPTGTPVKLIFRRKP
ncbi:MAG: hypothetical protein FJ395_09905 [Verrucomicrobia bacterium]|nr:hypothetical protein [Verrucomicrobiota bacterium]